MSGRSSASFPIFVGRRYQQGYGVGGGMMSNLMKFAIPLVKPVAKKLLSKIKTEAVRTGSDIVQDVLFRKQSPKQALKKRGKESIRRVMMGTSNHSPLFNRPMKRKKSEGKGIKGNVKRARTIPIHGAVASKRNTSKQRRKPTYTPVDIFK